VETPTRYSPSVAVEEVDDEDVVMRIAATPLNPDDGSRLAEEVLATLQGVATPSAS
jgi:hypothetical protein